jgi:uncharacterized protein YdhG (YjbR/CyaY superfamily)
VKSGYKTIDEYILSFPRPVQVKLNEIRELIRATAPQAREKISYQMPTFYLNGNLVHFAAHSNHIGLYPTPSAGVKFKRELSGYQRGKGSIQFPLEKPLPHELIRKIVKFRVDENLKKGQR